MIGDFVTRPGAWPRLGSKDECFLTRIGRGQLHDQGPYCAAAGCWSILLNIRLGRDARSFGTIYKVTFFVY